MEILDFEEADEVGYIDYYGDALDEDDYIVSVDAGVSTGVTEVVPKQVEGVQQAVNYSSLLSHMFKYPSLITQGFKQNIKAQEKLFKHMFNFGVHIDWSNGILAVSSYLHVETSKYQYLLLNTFPLEFVVV